jgi:ATP-dependent exoDNAse (exonuclease V) alpha subunit
VKDPVILSLEFKGILDHLEYSEDHIFVTGKAGTGKSTLLQVFRTSTKKRVIVLAPTGIAALNVRGQTIHSFFGFPPRILNRSEIEKRRNFRMYCNIDMIIIDEISMVRADMMDNMDYFLQVNRSNPTPFGGVQMVFFGDLFQLPPVVSSPFEKEYFHTKYTSPYFFDAFIMRKVELKMFELLSVYRQEERSFISLLDNIRKNELDYEDFITINERHLPIPEDDDYYITLCTRNDIVNRINEHELKILTGRSVTFSASVTGDFNPQLFPADFNLDLREGAQVMFVRNDTNKQYVNGTIGIVHKLDEDSIIVSIPDDGKYGFKLIEVEKAEWEIIKYELDPEKPNAVTTKIVGTFKQYPLKLAWAITIHKSQGKTFNRVIIDMGGGAFESGQTYVALSRCRTLGGIILKHPINGRDIIVDERISQFYQEIKYLN